MSAQTLPTLQDPLPRLPWGTGRPRGQLWWLLGKQGLKWPTPQSRGRTLQGPTSFLLLPSFQAHLGCGLAGYVPVVIPSPPVPVTVLGALGCWAGVRGAREGVRAKATPSPSREGWREGGREARSLEAAYSGPLPRTTLLCPSPGLEPWWAEHGLAFGVSSDTGVEIMNSSGADRCPEHRAVGRLWPWRPQFHPSAWKPSTAGAGILSAPLLTPTGLAALAVLRGAGFLPSTKTGAGKTRGRLGLSHFQFWQT